MILDLVSANSISFLTTDLPNATIFPGAGLPELTDGLGNTQLSLVAAASNDPPTEFSPQDLATAQALNPGNGGGSPFDKFRSKIGERNSQGQFDKQDFYKFQGGGTMSVALTGLSKNADIQILDSTGFEVAHSTSSGSSSEVINLSNLSSDTYYIRVYQEDPEETPYDVQASNNNIPDLIVAEQKINNLSGTKTFSSGISDRDTSDIYQFSLNTTSNVSVSLSGLVSQLDPGLDIGVRVIRDRNNDGVITDSEVILDSGNLINPSQPLNLLGLGSGTYFVQVYQNGSGNISRYNLKLTATAGVGIAPEPNNSLAEAFNLGILNGSRGFTNTISNRGINPNQVDFYQFTIASNSNSNPNSTLNLNLTGLSANVDLQLLASNGTVLKSSLNLGNAAESIQQSLSPGTYYVKVFAGSVDPVITSYTLNLAG